MQSAEAFTFAKLVTASKPAPLVLADAPAPTTAKPSSDIMAMLEADSAKAAQRGNTEMSELLGKVTSMISGPHTPDDLRETIAAARELNKKSGADFGITRTLLAVSRFTHEQMGNQSGMLIMSDEAKIAQATERATQKFGTPKPSADVAQPTAAFTPAAPVHKNQIFLSSTQ